MIPKTQSLREEWKKYRDTIYPEGISGVQNRETHQAFYAGAFIICMAMLEASQLPDDDAVKLLESLIKEAEETMKKIHSNMKGRN
jgi:hypothetical protein